MSDLAFALHLGGGLYLDSDGTLHQGPPPDVPVYEAPFKLPVDPKVVRDAVGEVKKALKDIDKHPDVLKKFADFGFNTDILVMLSVIGKIAGVIAPVLAVVSFAFDVAKLLGLFKDGPDPLEQLITARFDELEDHVEAIAALIQAQDLKEGRIAVENFVSSVKNHVDQLKNTNPSVSQLEIDRNTLVTEHNIKVNGVAKLLDVQTWQTMFDRDEHSRVWAWMAGVLFTQPGGPGVAPKPAILPADGMPHFDHRLMVPLASYAAESYLACIRGISPEFRTTGDFRDHVRTFATKIDKLAQSMREHVLARTMYKREHFAWPVLVPPQDVVFSGTFPNLTAKISPRCSRWPVGALDLRYHDNQFFEPFLNSLWKSDVHGWPHPTKHGGMDLRWIPPAVLAPADFGNYKITNPDECAAAANLQSEKDYADLLSVSGYTELLQLAVLFRSEATEPNKSQTVVPQTPSLYRNPLASSPVTVKSDSIFMTGVITSDATREPQECIASLRIATQPIKRARPVEYQIKLRTLSSIVSKKRWREPAYKEYHWAQYEQDPQDAAFKRLEFYTSDLALDDHFLIAGTTPRDETRRAEDVAHMKAHTFDWWIPVGGSFSLDVPFADTLAELRAAGVFRTTRDPAPVPGGSQLQPSASLLYSGSYAPHVFDLIPELAWKPGGQDWDGEHREVKEETITIEYRLEWNADRLFVSLKNDPADRNYVVYVVVEEKMPGTGHVLHTAVPIPINGQLTYVPQKFFDEEREAYEQAEDTITYFNEKYSESAEIGPLDPVVGWLRPGHLASSEGIEQFVTVAERHQPELLQQVIAEVTSRRRLKIPT